MISAWANVQSVAISATDMSKILFNMTFLYKRIQLLNILYIAFFLAIT